MKNKKIFIVIAILVIICVGTIVGVKSFDKDETIMSFKEAEGKRQFKLNIRKNHAGIFEVKPFKFNDIGSNKIYVFFRNEGTNPVSIDIYKIDENKDSNNMHETFEVGESKKIMFECKKEDMDKDYCIQLLDSTEPNPIVVGEFLLSTHID